MTQQKYTADDLRQMQAWPLERKIQVTQTRIIEFSRRFNGQIYVSFSGGKDSTVLLDLVRWVYPDTPAVFVDTGLEFPEIREFVKSVPNVTWIKPEMNFRQVIEKYGYPVISKDVAQSIYEGRRNRRSRAASKFDPTSEYSLKYPTFCLARYRSLLDSGFPISHMCCMVMKKKPAVAYERVSGRHPLVGTMASESAIRRNQWMQTGCNAFEGKRPRSRPMSFWTEQDVLEYIERFNLPYASVYGEILLGENGKYYTTGYNRTGCVFCAFGAHLEKEPNRFQRLKQTHPKLWEYCMRPWDEGGLGMRDVLQFINVKVD